ncbi:hypothetical protein [Micromonospora sp. NPDC048947]|uniref:arsenate reductase/protein-tyrosine-phosphatase family protein n=1 Tax=Micromonospora sp. NPDC048947 TaxID=3154826 RepID=UPI0033D7FF2C
MRENFGVDVADRRPQHLDTLTGRRFDYVITLCDKAREVCPDFGNPDGKLHWSIPDPAVAGTGNDYPAFLQVTADIDTRVRHLLPVLVTEPEETRP